MNNWPVSVAILLVIALTNCGLQQHVVAREPSPELIPVNWRGVDGNWSQRFNWGPTGTVPNNTPNENYSVTIDSGNVTVDIPVVLSELFLNGKELDLQQTLSTDVFVLDGTFVTGDAGLKVDGDVVLRRGTLNNTAIGQDAFVVGGNIVKRGHGFVVLAPFEPGGNYEILVEQGTLRLSNGGQGTSDGAISITNPEFARLMAYDLSSLTDDIYLNNARGFANSGAIVSSRQSSRSSVFSDIYLGDRGSVIGSTDRMTITGGIHGGSLDIVGSGSLILTSGNHTYSGTTSVGSNGDNSLLILGEEGAIPSSTGIVIGGRAQLFLNNDRQTLDDRLPDSAPIKSLGGTLDFDREGTTPVTEQVGNLVLAQGATEVSSGGNQSSWAFESLTRLGLATVNFRRNNFTDNDPSIRFDTALPLSNSIIGGWATLNNRDFATDDVLLGIVPLGNRMPRPNQIEGAGSNDHVRIQNDSPQPLTADRTIGTLAVEVSGKDLDLAGHRLTISQGGLVLQGSSFGSTSISQGELTAGTSADPAAIYLHSNGGRSGRGFEDVNIRAAIVDNQQGGAVSLVKSGLGEASLSGENTYSGATVVQQGRLVFAAATALPIGSQLLVDSGSALINYQSTEPIHLSKLTLSQGGFLGYGPDGDTEINADEYILESGVMFVPLSGDGVLLKTTAGSVSLGVSSTNFQGDVVIEDGFLVAGTNSSVMAAPLALGNGNTTILPGGTLVHSSVLEGAGYMLLDANLNLAGGDVGLGVSIRTPRWDFDGDWQVTAPSRLLMFDHSGDDEITISSGDRAPPTVNVLQQVSLSDGSGLTILGEGEVDFVRGIDVAGNTFLDVAEGIATLNGFTSSSNGATLELRGKGVFNLPQDLITEGAEDFTIEVTPSATAGLDSRLTTIGRGVTLSLNGPTTGRLSFLLEGGTLTGSNLGGEIQNIGGWLAPGDGIGEVHVTSISQNDEGVLLMELLGGSMPSSDVIRTQNAILSGFLSVSVVSGTQVVPGDEFDLIIADSLDTQGLELITDGFSGRLTVVPLTSGRDVGKMALRLSIVVPEPASVSLLLLCCALFPRRWRGNDG